MVEPPAVDGPPLAVPPLQPHACAGLDLAHARETLDRFVGSGKERVVLAAREDEVERRIPHCRRRAGESLPRVREERRLVEHDGYLARCGKVPGVPRHAVGDVDGGVCDAPEAAPARDADPRAPEQRDGGVNLGAPAPSDECPEPGRGEPDFPSDPHAVPGTGATPAHGSIRPSRGAWW